MAPHSSTLAWTIPWTEEPCRLWSMGSLRVRHDWASSLSLFTFMHWRRKWQPLQCSCLENPRDGGAWWAAVYGVTQSQTRLKRLSSSSNTRKNSPCYVPIPFFFLPYLQLFFWTHCDLCSSSNISTFAAFIPLFMCFCHQEQQPSQEKTNSAKILFFFSCQYQEVASSQTDLDASHLSVCSPCLSCSCSDCTLESKYKLYCTQQGDT